MELSYPLGDKGTVTSRYGKRWGRSHNGIDVAVPVGTSVRSIADGEVVRSDIRDVNGYGNFIIVKHNINGETLFSCYAHLSKRISDVGDKVKKGEEIGKSGGARGAVGSGMSTGPHLHFEIRKSQTGDFINPESYLGGAILANIETGSKTKKEPRTVDSKKFFKSEPIKIISTPSDHSKRAFGNWESDNAYDIQAPVGTSVYSITAGKVKSKKVSSGSNSKIFGTQLSITGIDNYPDVFYTHLEQVNLNVGDTVSPGDYIGKITEWKAYPSASHVHISVTKGHDVFNYMDKNGNIKDVDNYLESDVDEPEDNDGKSKFDLSKAAKTLIPLLPALKKNWDKTVADYKKEKGLNEEVIRIKDIMKKIL
jgi:murein DD-endopeptidase MepM/ murein hydrolase activator NlpD